jgi:hypothetical protein
MTLPSGIALFASLALSIVKLSAQEWAWTRQTGNTYNSSGKSCLLVDSSGNAVLNAGNRPHFLAKFDPEGNLVWVREGYGMDFALDGNNNLLLTGFLLGRFTFGDTNLAGGSVTLERRYDRDGSFLVKLDPEGRLRWAALTEGWIVRSMTVAADARGGIFISGEFQDRVTFSSASAATNAARTITLTMRAALQDTFTAKYSAEGELLWAQNGGGLDLIVDKEGNYLLTGYFSGTTPFGTEGTTLTAVSPKDMFLAKYDREGRLLWVRQGPPVRRPDYRETLGMDGEGNIYANTQGRLIKYDPEGRPLWPDLGSPAAPLGDKMAVNSDGTVYAVGDFTGSITFGNTTLVSRGPQTDIFIVKYQPDGAVAWAKQAGGVNTDSWPDVAVGPGADVWLTGGFFRNTIIGGTELSGPAWQMFVARLSAGLPMILAQPQNVRTNPGAIVTFSITLTNASNPRFQWRKDGLDLVDDRRITGSTHDRLVIAPVQEEDAGNYSVVVRADNGVVTSSPAALWFGPITRFISKTMLTNGIFQLDFVGEPGRLYNIEASADGDFRDRSYITNFFCGEGYIRVIDWKAREYPNRFYRAVSPDRQPGKTGPEVRNGSPPLH